MKNKRFLMGLALFTVLVNLWLLTGCRTLTQNGMDADFTPADSGLSVSGRILLPGDNPASGVTVVLQRQVENRAYITLSHSDTQETTTNERGQYFLDDVAPGTYTLKALSEAGMAVVQTVVLETHSLSIQTVVLEETGVVSGNVTLQSMTTHDGILVYVPGTVYAAVTEDSGNYRLSLPPGQYELMMSHAGYSTGTISNVFVSAGGEVAASAIEMYPLEGRQTNDDLASQIEWLLGESEPTGNMGEEENFYIHLLTGDLYQKMAGEWIKVNIAYDTTWLTGYGSPGQESGGVGDLYFNKSNSNVYQKDQEAEWIQFGNMKGPTGDPGERGATGNAGLDSNQWLVGEGEPYLIGVNGDLYLDSDRGDIYYRSYGDWRKVGNMAGPTGPQGPEGAEGPQGEKGDPPTQYLPVTELHSITIDDFETQTSRTGFQRRMSLDLSTSGANVSGYAVFYSTSLLNFAHANTMTQSKMITVLEDQPVDFTDFEDQTTYYIRVAAIDSDGNQGPLSNPISFTYTSPFSQTTYCYDYTQSGYYHDQIYLLCTDLNGMLYFGSRWRDRVERFDPTGDWRGTTELFTGLSRALGVAVDNNGWVWATLHESGVIVHFDPDDYAATKVTYGAWGTGVGEFRHPDGIAVDANGLVYVADWSNARIVRFNPASPTWTDEWETYAYQANAFTFDLSGLMVAVSHGSDDIIIFDWDDPDRDDNRIDISGFFDDPWSVAIDQSNRILVCDWSLNRVIRFDRNNITATLTAIGGPGTERNKPGVFVHNPRGLAVLPDGRIAVGEAYALHILDYDGYMEDLVLYPTGDD